MKPEKLLKKLKKLRARKNYDKWLGGQKLYIRSWACGEVVDHWITSDEELVRKANTCPQKASWFVNNGVKKITRPALATEYFARNFDDYLYSGIDGIIEFLQDCIDGRNAPYLRVNDYLYESTGTDDYLQDCIDSGEIPYLSAIEYFLKEQSKGLDWFDNSRDG